jgi:hypothetical protein
MLPAQALLAVAAGFRVEVFRVYGLGWWAADVEL